MKHTHKGFTLISSLLIIIGIAIIGGGAYFVGKSVERKSEVKVNLDSQSSVEDQNFTSTQNIITTPQETSSGCSKTSTPSISILSPNGGETYTSGQKITVKWKSCNVGPVGLTLIGFPYPSDREVFLGNWSTNASSGNETVTIPNSITEGKYVVSVSTPPETLPSGVEDVSDNYFTIKALAVSATLPGWLGAQEGWPPVIKYSSNLYSCTIGRVGMGVPVSTTEKTINGRKYCISVADEGATGTIYYTYTYTTADTNRTDNPGTLTTHFTLGWHNVMCTNTFSSTPGNIICHPDNDSTQPISFNVDSAVDYYMYP